VNHSKEEKVHAEHEGPVLYVVAHVFGYHRSWHRKHGSVLPFAVFGKVLRRCDINRNDSV
jgi:hypothetical protein